MNELSINRNSEYPHQSFFSINHQLPKYETLPSMSFLAITETILIYFWK